MANILMTWELGGGLGHMMPMRALGDGLVRAGHRVYAALRDLTVAHRAFAGSHITCLQAPFKQRNTRDSHAEIITFSHILWNTGFSDAQGLWLLAGAWRQLFEMIKPDMIIFDHSPTALLASRGLPVKRVLLGTAGFSCPPLKSPMPNLRPWLRTSPDALIQDEANSLHVANEVLTRWQLPTMSNLSDLFNTNGDILLYTLPVLDPFAPREQGRYFQVVAPEDGVAPHWPEGTGPKVLCYLKPFPALGALLKHLTARGVPALLFVPDISPQAQKQFASPLLHFSDKPLNLPKLASQCDLAILNGTNAATIQMLQAGVPTLQVPIVLEQVYTARAVERLGAGLGTSPEDAAALTRKLDLLLQDGRWRDGARRFAASPQAVDAEPIEHAVSMLLRRLQD